ncbi:MAG: patatin-like phospholipase family protein [Bacillota bacterium]|jgi:NTE family protein
MGKSPVIGLALGAGALKGFAHLGVLKVLTAEKVPVHLIAGSSIGSVFGAFFAAGVDLAFLEKIFEQLPPQGFFDLAVPKMGLIRGNKIESFLRLLIKNKHFADLHIPLYVVAVDLEKGEKVVISEGPVADAVRGSIAIPGIFTPKFWQGRLLVDGAVLDRVPISTAREQGADVVIAVDVKFGGDQNRTTKVTNIFEVILNSIELMEKEVVKTRLQGADILIQPDLSAFSSSDFSKIKELIRKGEEEARKKLPCIKAVLAAYESAGQPGR